MKEVRIVEKMLNDRPRKLLQFKTPNEEFLNLTGRKPTYALRGGFRVCYYYLVHRGFVFLLWIYAKNEQEDLTATEKASLKSIITMIKKEKIYE